MMDEHGGTTPPRLFERQTSRLGRVAEYARIFLFFVIVGLMFETYRTMLPESSLSGDAAEPLTGIESLRYSRNTTIGASSSSSSSSSSSRSSSSNQAAAGLTSRNAGKPSLTSLLDHGEEHPPSSSSTSISTSTSTSTSSSSQTHESHDAQNQRILELEATVEELRQQLAAARSSINHNNSSSSSSSSSSSGPASLEEHTWRTLYQRSVENATAQSTLAGALKISLESCKKREMLACAEPPSPAPVPAPAPCEPSVPCEPPVQCAVAPPAPPASPPAATTTTTTTTTTNTAEAAAAAAAAATATTTTTTTNTTTNATSNSFRKDEVRFGSAAAQVTCAAAKGGETWGKSNRVAHMIAGNARTIFDPRVYQTVQTNFIEAFGGAYNTFLYLKLEDDPLRVHGEKMLPRYSARVQESKLAGALRVLGPTDYVITKGNREVKNPRCKLLGYDALMRLVAQLDTLRECFRLVEKYEAANHMTFDWVTRIRPDVAMAYPIKPICFFDHRYTYLPATPPGQRELKKFEDVHFYIDHVSIMPRTQAPYLVKAYDTYAECTGQLEWRYEMPPVRRGDVNRKITDIQAYLLWQQPGKPFKIRTEVIPAVLLRETPAVQQVWCGHQYDGMGGNWKIFDGIGPPLCESFLVKGAKRTVVGSSSSRRGRRLLLDGRGQNETASTLRMASI